MSTNRHPHTRQQKRKLLLSFVEWDVFVSECWVEALTACNCDGDIADALTKHIGKFRSKVAWGNWSRFGTLRCLFPCHSFILQISLFLLPGRYFDSAQPIDFGEWNFARIKSLSYNEFVGVQIYLMFRSFSHDLANQQNVVTFMESRLVADRCSFFLHGKCFLTTLTFASLFGSPSQKASTTVPLTTLAFGSESSLCEVSKTSIAQILIVWISSFHEKFCHRSSYCNFPNVSRTFLLICTPLVIIWRNSASTCRLTPLLVII